jgi:tight adherence protein C
MDAWPHLPLLAAALAFAAMLLGLSGLRNFLAARGRAALVRLRARVQSGRAGARAGGLSGLAGWAAALGQKVLPVDAAELSASRRLLVGAGWRGPRSVAVFWGARAALSVLPAAALVLGRLAAGHAGVLLLAGASALGLAGFHLPMLFLRHVADKRREAFSRGLAEALDLLTVCVEAGMGLDQALARVGREMERGCPVLSEELRLLHLELRAGKARAEALRSLADRVGVEDLNNLVTLLVQADSFGTSVASTLRVYSDSLRTARFTRAEETASKLPAKLMLPLILCIFPALLVVIGGPAIISLMGVAAGLK